MKNLFCFALLIVLLTAIPLQSQINLNKTAQSTMNFLLVGTSARASALGESFSTEGYGAENIFYNPAGLSGLNEKFNISINYTSWIADINYYSGGAAWNLGTAGVLGVHLITVDYGSINGTSLLAPGEDASFPLGYKENGLVNNVGAFSVGLSYSKAISQEFSIGGTVKYAGQNLGENIYSGVSEQNDAAKIVFDAGVRYKTGYNDFNFGMYIRNFSTSIKREEIDEQLPLLFAIGAGINVLKFVDESFAGENKLTLMMDFLHPNNYSERINLGLEYFTLDMLSLRLGYQTNRDLASWSGGLGFNTAVSGYKIYVDYSYSRFQYFSGVNRLSLSFCF